MIAIKLKTLLATSFTFYLKAHKYHWNIMGPDFAQYHDYLGELYEEVHGSIDTTAEVIRTTGELVPGSYGEYTELSMIESDENEITNAQAMIQQLIADNKVICSILSDAFSTSEAEGTIDISDYLAGRLGVHRKHGWMLNSFVNQQQV